MRNSETLNKTQLSLDGTVTFNGHHSLRHRLQRITGVDYVPQLLVRWGNYTGAYGDMDEVWIRDYVRWDVGFTTETSAAYSGGNSYKWYRIGFGELGRFLGASNFADGSPLSGVCINEMSYGNAAGTRHSYIAPTMTSLDAGTPYQDGQWYERIMTVKRFDNTHSMARIWMTPVGQSRTLQAVIHQYDGRVGTINKPRTYTPLVNFNAPLVDVTDQSAYIGAWEIYDEAVTPDPFGLGSADSVVVDYTATLAIDNATISVAAGGASVNRTLTLTRAPSFSTTTFRINATYDGNYDECGPAPTVANGLLPSGLSLSVSTALLTSGLTTSTLTIVATGATAPGTYSVVLYAAMHKNTTGPSTNAYVTLNLTVT